MIRTIFVAGTAIAVMAAPALAADIARTPYAVPAPVGGFNWSGGYVGANFGYQFGSISNIPADPRGFLGGVQAGYNWQSGQIVFGAEADLQASNADDRFAAYKFSNPWFGTMRGRVGYAMNNLLFYATAGFAYGTGKIELGPLSSVQTHFGWTAGGGVEVGLTPHWSVKAEYLYIDLSAQGVLNAQGWVLTGASSGIQSNLLRFGVNYRF
jgi:outer membrane immunogenic protein